MIDSCVGYRVRLPVFEGPLDLLLHLVQKRELDITAVSLASVADQYLEYIKSLEQMNAEAVADFLVIAAKLLVLKSSSLFSSSEPFPEAEEVAHDLAAALLEYQLFKQAAMDLRQREEADHRSYPRTARPVAVSTTVLEKVPVDALVAGLLKYTRGERVDEDLVIAVPSRIFTVGEKMATIHASLAITPRITFRSLLEAATSRLEIVVTFMAVLDLLREGQVTVEQAGLFAEIYISLKMPEAVPTDREVNASSPGGAVSSAGRKEIV